MGADAVAYSSHVLCVLFLRPKAQAKQNMHDIEEYNVHKSLLYQDFFFSDFSYSRDVACA